MTNCQDIFDFLNGVANRQITTTLPDADLASLQDLKIVQRLTAEQYAQLVQSVQAVGADQAAIQQESAARAQLAASVSEEDSHTHSILFHLEGQEKRSQDEAKDAQDQSALKSTDADLARRIQEFNALLAQRSMLDTLSAYGGGYVGLTTSGLLELSQLRLRMYRVSGLPFTAYWAESQQIRQDFENLATLGARYVAGLSGALSPVDPGYLWSIGVGMAKVQPDPSMGGPAFLEAFRQLGPLTSNNENRLMSAEILTSARGDLASALPSLTSLVRFVEKSGVPKESSLGVASVLLLGQRADGTFATDPLESYLQLTRSYESAALLAIVNRPVPEISQKFSFLRSLFGSWGYDSSEDTELASAYLTLSDLPADGVNTKLAIISKGLGAYLQYPLVASAILAAVPVLEANESLNLLEEAYQIVGRYATPLSPPELICLAVRMVHGVRPQTIQNLDTTATAAPVTGAPSYLYGPRFFFVPIFVAHGAYYSTFSGIGGAHPGHAHFAAGGFTG